MACGVCAKDAPKLHMGAFGEQVFIHLAHDRAELVGIGEVPCATIVFGMDGVAARTFRQACPEKTGIMHLCQRLLCLVISDADAICTRRKNAERVSLTQGLHPQYCERITMGAVDDGLHRGGVGGRRQHVACKNIFRCLLLRASHIISFNCFCRTACRGPVAACTIRCNVQTHRAGDGSRPVQKAATNIAQKPNWFRCVVNAGKNRTYDGPDVKHRCAKTQGYD